MFTGYVQSAVAAGESSEMRRAPKRPTQEPAGSCLDSIDDGDADGALNVLYVAVNAVRRLLSTLHRASDGFVGLDVVEREAAGLEEAVGGVRASVARQLRAFAELRALVGVLEKGVWDKSKQLSDALQPAPSADAASQTEPAADAPAATGPRGRRKASARHPVLLKLSCPGCRTVMCPRFWRELPPQTRDGVAEAQRRVDLVAAAERERLEALVRGVCTRCRDLAAVQSAVEEHVAPTPLLPPSPAPSDWTSRQVLDRWLADGAACEIRVPKPRGRRVGLRLRDTDLEVLGWEPGSAAAAASEQITVGRYVVAVDGFPVARLDDGVRKLLSTAIDEVVFTFASAPLPPEGVAAAVSPLPLPHPAAPPPARVDNLELPPVLPLEVDSPPVAPCPQPDLVSPSADAGPDGQPNGAERELPAAADAAEQASSGSSGGASPGLALEPGDGPLAALSSPGGSPGLPLEPWGGPLSAASPAADIEQVPRRALRSAPDKVVPPPLAGPRTAPRRGSATAERTRPRRADAFPT